MSAVVHGSGIEAAATLCGPQRLVTQQTRRLVASERLLLLLLLIVLLLEGL